MAYLGLLSEARIDDVFELPDFVATDAPQLVAELAVLVNELLDDVHLLIELIELGVCEVLCVT